MSRLRGSQAKFLLIASMLLFGALIASVVPSSPALACTPTRTPTGFAGFTIADYINAADIIVEGTVTTVTDSIFQTPIRSGLGASLGEDAAYIEVQQYLKGSGQENIFIHGFGPSTACLIEVIVGTHRIFYAVQDAQGIFWILAINGSGPDTIVLQQQPSLSSINTPVRPTRPPDTPRRTTPSSNETTETSFLISYMLGILGITSLVILAYFARRLKR